MTSCDPKAFIRKIIRLHKRDSAFLYAIFEANEGWVTYSTLKGPVGVEYCDLELIIPASFETEMKLLLKELENLYYEPSETESETK